MRMFLAATSFQAVILDVNECSNISCNNHTHHSYNFEEPHRDRSFTLWGFEGWRRELRDTKPVFGRKEFLLYNAL